MNRVVASVRVTNSLVLACLLHIIFETGTRLTHDLGVTRIVHEDPCAA